MKLRANSYRRIYIVRGENQCQTSSSTGLHEGCPPLERTRDRFGKPILASGSASPSYDEAARQFLSKDLHSSWRKPVPNVVINMPSSTLSGTGNNSRSVRQTDSCERRCYSIVR